MKIKAVSYTPLSTSRSPLSGHRRWTATPNSRARGWAAADCALRTTCQTYRTEPTARGRIPSTVNRTQSTRLPM
ncbi:hypothetical protein ABB37_07894 [Leptomonas pyrrhocoris]|uniref:Uncharacterized protein n=1 Tax=Leptomonas pyrrhocoris TaxID=157538 RepID=A0A0M9FU45_LEPPY|nr:hypothetical protein ABB37_07894 [Leptomonas pyrrhocoris]KPA76125.1 hypothetical protein ABB37_07894 [Leptomonas pyrrhocoris]|eukprot:XP_015654564.1 hypothetical protein ABB37_07894 [Leptomonas pyrrhocoris]